MKEFNSNKWKQFIIAESDFGNDPQDRYNYVRKFTADLPDTARSEYLVSNLDDALEDFKLTDEVGEFDQAFVDIMKALGKENELFENLFSPNEMSAMAVEKEMAEGPNPSFVEEGEDSLINPEAEEIEDDDLAASADYFDSLAENDDVLDEILNEADFKEGDKVTMKQGGEEMEVVGIRKMFGNNTKAYKVKKANGEEVEYSANQLKKVMSPEEKANVFVR